MIPALFLWSVTHRAWVYAAAVVLTAAAALGLPRLEIDTSLHTLIPAGEPQRVEYQRVMAEFGSDNKTIVYIRDSELFSPATLRQLDGLVRDMKRISGVTRVDSLYSLRTVEGERAAPDADAEITARPVLDGIPATAMEAERARTRALSNPLYIGNLISEDGNVTAAIVTVRDPDDGEDFSERVYEELEAVLEKYRGGFDEMFQVGPPRIGAELRQGLFEDLVLLGPLSALVLVLSILAFMRNALAAVIPLATSAIAIVWTFGTMGYAGVPLNILSAMVPSLIIVIGSTEDTHMIAAWFRGYAHAGRSDREARLAATHYMARHTGLPLLLTVLTTALGFASNLLVDITLIIHFAIASTLAIVFNGIITLLLVPPLLAQFGRGHVSGGQETETLPGQIIALFRNSQDHHALSILVVTALLCGFFAWQASTLYVTNDPMSYFPQDRPIIQQTHAIHEDLAGVKVFFVALEAEDEDAFLQPENVRKLAAIQDFIARQNAFDNSLSLADHLAYVHREFQGAPTDVGLPQTRQLIAQLLLFFHRSELESYVSHDFRMANIIVRHNLSDSDTLNRHISALEDAVDHIAGPDIKASIVGENLLVNQSAGELMTSQVKALALLLFLIFIIMSIMFTSPRGGAIAMIPSIIPIVLMFGLMGLLDIPLNPGTAMVAVIAIGIAVDGTIHLLARYNELCRTTSDYQGAVHAAVQEVASPLIVSSLALALGFGILLFSNFTVVAQFGALAAFTMLVSIFANLLVTPIVMFHVRLVGLYQIIGMKVDKQVLAESPLFAGMSNYQRRKAILISEMHRFEAGEKLVSQGEVGRSMYMILEGSAQVVRQDGQTTRELADLSPGDIFGEVGYIQPIERTADVIASEPLVALRFDYERMQKDLRFFPNIVAQLNFNISAILGTRLADVLAANAEKKVEV